MKSIFEVNVGGDLYSWNGIVSLTYVIVDTFVVSTDAEILRSDLKSCDDVAAYRTVRGVGSANVGPWATRVGPWVARQAFSDKNTRPRVPMVFWSISQFYRQTTPISRPMGGPGRPMGGPSSFVQTKKPTHGPPKPG